MPQLDITTFFLQVTSTFFAFFLFFNFFSYYLLPSILLVLNLRMQNIFFLNKKILTLLCVHFVNVQKKRGFYYLLFSFFDKSFRIFFEKFFLYFHSFFQSIYVENIWKSFSFPFYFNNERINNDSINS